MDLVQFLLNQLDKPVKTFMYRFNLDKWSCRHCGGRGVCEGGWNNMGDKHSCNSCVLAYKPDDRVDKQARVKCAICQGTGRESNYELHQKLKIESGGSGRESTDEEISDEQDVPPKYDRAGG